MYDRTLKPIPQPPSTGKRYRFESLVGITGAKMSKYRSSWYDVILSPFNVLWRPHLLSALIFEVLRSLAGFYFESLQYDRQCFSASVLG